MAPIIPTAASPTFSTPMCEAAPVPVGASVPVVEDRPVVVAMELRSVEETAEETVAETEEAPVPVLVG